MYIDKANTLFETMNMKSLRRLLCVLIVTALPLAHGAEEWRSVADQVGYCLDPSKKETVCELRGVHTMAGVGDLFKECKIKPQSGEEEKTMGRWFLLNIPVKIYAMCKKKPAHYVRELKVTVYLLVSKPSGSSSEESENSSLASKYNLLKKEITYVDIPLEKNPLPDDGRLMGQASMNVGIFIPKSTAAILTAKFNSPISVTDLSKVIKGYAVLASLDGQSCPPYTASKDKTKPVPGGGTRCSRLLDGTLANALSDKKWWSEDGARSKFAESDLEICSIAESPYAAFYSAYYPRVKPMYGAPSSATRDSFETDKTSSSSSGVTTSSTTRGGSRSTRSGTAKNAEETAPERKGATSHDGEDYDSDL